MVKQKFSVYRLLMCLLDVIAYFACRVTLDDINTAVPTLQRSRMLLWLWLRDKDRLSLTADACSLELGSVKLVRLPSGCSTVNCRVHICVQKKWPPNSRALQSSVA